MCGPAVTTCDRSVQLPALFLEKEEVDLPHSFVTSITFFTETNVRQ